MPNLRWLWILIGIALILAGVVLGETIVALALIPVGLAIMAYGGLRK